MKRIFIIFQLSVLLFACGGNEVEKVEATFEEGKPKVIAKYKVQEGKDVKVFEKELYENGNTRMEGAIANNNRTGIWKAYFEDGTLWTEGEYLEGKRNGAAKNYYPHGKLRYEGFYTLGKKSGHWKFYNENGQLIEEKEF